MDDMERQLIRARILHRNLLRLGVSTIACSCGETDPICFSVDHMFEKANGNDICGTCANCVAIRQAPKDAASREAKIASLKKKGVHILRCLCSQDNVYCLQADHVDGEKFGDKVYALCRNCHLKRTARQLSEHPGFYGDPNNPFVRLANRAGAQADFHEFSADHLREMEEELLILAKNHS
jgi:hypothetical protein